MRFSLPIPCYLEGLVETTLRKLAELHFLEVKANPGVRLMEAPPEDEGYFFGSDLGEEVPPLPQLDLG